MLAHCGWHLFDMSGRLKSLHAGKPGTIREIKHTLMQIESSLRDLNSPTCQHELAACELSEQKPRKKTFTTAHESNTNLLKPLFEAGLQSRDDEESQGKREQL